MSSLIFWMWIAASAASANAPAPTVIVIDSSNSMSAALNGEPRLDTARTVLNQLLAAWRSDALVGLIAYGHRRTGDCGDIEVLAPIGPVDPPALAARLTALRARGKTPLTSSIERAAGLLEESGAGGTIILVTDGVETCHADPCAVAAALRAAHADVTIHVIGFAVETKDEEQLSCIAKAGGGDYRTALNAASLLEEMDRAAAKAVEPPPEAPTPPAPAPPVPAPPVPEAPRIVQVAFSAVIEGTGPLVDHPAAWRVTGLGPGDFHYEGTSRGLALELAPGRYVVEARASNAIGTGEFEVSGEKQAIEVVLLAGRLSANAVPYKGAPELTGVTWAVEPLDGQPALDAAALVQPAWLLASGRYRIVATHEARSTGLEVTVVPGAPAEATLSFKLGRLQLLAATAPDAEPLSDWRGLTWRVVDEAGAMAGEYSNAARPLLVLPADTYRIDLGIAGTTVSQSVDVVEGTLKEERLIVPTGKRTFTVALSVGSEPLTDWRDASWTVTATEAVGITAGTALIENQMVASLVQDLLPGSWSVRVTSGLASASREIIVAPGSAETVRLDLDAARLTVQAAPAAGEAAAANVVFKIAPIGADGTVGTLVTLGGAQNSLSSIVSAGRWHIVADDEGQRHGEQDVDLKPGDETNVVLMLQ